MTDILRNEEKSINFVGELLTVGSQISILAPARSCLPSCHWFTATPIPKFSVFKPVIFYENIEIGNWTKSPNFDDQPKSTFQTSIDRRHPLYKMHEKVRSELESGSQNGQKLQVTLREMERQCMTEVIEFLRTFDESQISDILDIFSCIAETEIKFYV